MGKKCKIDVILKKSSSLLRDWFRQTSCVVTMTKKRFTKIVNFMTPGAGVLVLGHGHISHIVEMHYFFKNLLCKFHDPRDRGFCARAWPYKSYSENALFL